MTVIIVEILSLRLLGKRHGLLHHDVFRLPAHFHSFHSVKHVKPDWLALALDLALFKGKRHTNGHVMGVVRQLEILFMRNEVKLKGVGASFKVSTQP